MACGLEIQVAQAVALTAPHERPAADNSQPLPRKRLIGRRTVRILEIVDKPVVVVLHACVALLLYGPRLEPVERYVPVLEMKRRHVLREFFRRDIAAGFENRDAQTGLGKTFRGPSARGTRSDHDCIIGFASEDPGT